jgi:hypothetical protein
MQREEWKEEGAGSKEGESRVDAQVLLRQVVCLTEADRWRLQSAKRGSTEGECGRPDVDNPKANSSQGHACERRANGSPSSQYLVEFAVGHLQVLWIATAQVVAQEAVPSCKAAASRMGALARCTAALQQRRKRTGWEKFHAQAHTRLRV